MSCSSTRSAVIGRNVSSPTTSSTWWTVPPARRCRRAPQVSGEVRRWAPRPTPDAPRTPSGSARDRSSAAVMYGGSGTRPARFRASSRSVPASGIGRTSRWPSPRSSPISNRSAPTAERTTSPAVSFRDGRHSASHHPARSGSDTGSNNRTSPVPPVARVMATRAGSTRVSLTTTTSPGRISDGRSRTNRWSGGASGPRSTRSRAASRGSIGRLRDRLVGKLVVELVGAHRPDQRSATRGRNHAPSLSTAESGSPPPGVTKTSSTPSDAYPSSSATAPSTSARSAASGVR